VSCTSSKPPRPDALAWNQLLLIVAKGKSTVNPQPSTLNPQPSTLNPQPSTFHQVLLIVAEEKSTGKLVAGALNLIGGDCLYGRNWGCSKQYDSLHFELVY
jgi:hypothetical protein